MVSPTRSKAEQVATVFETVRSAAAGLRAAGIDTPEHDAKLLLAEAFGTDLQTVDKAMLMGYGPDGLAAHASGFDGMVRHAGTEEPSKHAGVGGIDASDSSEPAMEAMEQDSYNTIETALREFRGMVERRAGREPLQHITGHTPFRYLDLKVGPGVFIPRQETELIVQEGIDWITRHGMYSVRAVDLCAGSGAIGLALVTEVPGAKVWAVEKSERAARWTRRNLEETVRTHPNVAGDYHLEIADATQAPTLSQLNGTIDMVLTNPPYVPLADVPRQPEVRDYDPDMALYGGSADGALIPERIIARAADLLRSGGLLVMEHDITQGERLSAFADTHGFGKVAVHDDYTGRPRFLTAEKI
ncbi:MAG TPA: peptide chain release factor N(5)-glutamine methyltransferase [Bifidobacterium sp.]|nr:peptide chain release factor N(5)-glutamine methyltransferase [Bifidobacterium sp.]